MKSGSEQNETARLLIVSSHSTLDHCLTAMLKEEGFGIELVETGSEAIQKVIQHKYDMVLWDNDFGEAQSFLSIQSLTGLGPLPPVIFTVTAHTSPQQKIELLKNGAFDLLSKPCQWHELKVSFQRALLVKRLKGRADRISQKLTTSDERFKTVVQASPDAIVLGDEWGNILFWNGAAERMFGYSSEEVIGRPLTLLMPNRYHKAHQEGLARVRATHKLTVIGHTVELTGLRKDGAEFPIELSLSYSLLENQIFYCGIIRDITPDKEVEKALQESEDRFRLTIDHIHDAVFYGDLSGRVLWANSQVAKLVGRPLETIIGYPLMECFSAEAANKAESRLASVREGLEVSPREEFEINRPDGTSRILEATVRTVQRDKKITGRLLVGRDITERKKAELDLIERNRFLELDAKVAQVISQSQELGTLLQGCAEVLVHYLDAALVRIWLLDRPTQVLILQGSAGLYTHLNGIHGRVPVGELKVGQIALEKRPFLTNAVIGDPRIPDQEWAKREKLVAFAGYPLLQAQEVIGVLGLFARHQFTDFTLKQLEMVADRITTAVGFQAARKSNKSLAELNDLILATAGEGIFGVNLEGRTIFINPAAAGILGYEIEELQDVAIMSMIYPADRGDGVCNISGCPILAAFVDGACHQGDEEYLRRKNGSVFPVEYTTTPMWEDGKVVGAVVMFKDISNRKRAEEAEKRFCQQLEATLAALPGSILVVDREQRVRYANAEALLHFGPEGGSILGTPIHQLLPFTAEQWNRVAAGLASLVPGSAKGEQDHVFERNDRLYSYRLFHISLEDPDVQQTGVVIWDITERKKLQDQVIQSEKLASLGTLVSGMVHEVRNPMQAIVGYTDLILEEDNLRVCKEHARDLKRVSQHITTVLTDFLTYARPSSQEPAKEVDLNARLIEALKMVQRGPAFGCVEVVQDMDDLPPVSVRQGDLDHVLINLVTNAVQAMEGTGRLTLATRHNEEVVTVQVSDTGCGMPKDILNKIFEPFFSTKPKGKGTGMGLSIVHQIVRSYGGRITIESKVGEGTSFTVQLPVLMEEGLIPAQPASQDAEKC